MWKYQQRKKSYRTINSYLDTIPDSTIISIDDPVIENIVVKNPYKCNKIIKNPYKNRVCDFFNGLKKLLNNLFYLLSKMTFTRINFAEMTKKR